MKNRRAVALALIAGFGLGAVSIHTLRAQAKPPAFAIIETDAIVQYPNMDQLKSFYGSPEFKQSRKQGDGLASFRILGLEGVPQR